jgi:Tfp pilus assembly protein PilV
MISLHTESGFSLVETLVAITILLLVIVGPMSISSSVSRSTSYSSDQVIASFLAQEGAELVQKARDDLQLQYYAGEVSTPWDDFVSTVSSSRYSDCFDSDGCGLYLINSTDQLADAIDCASSRCRVFLRGKANLDSYTHRQGSGSTVTPYTRVIKLSHPSSGVANREVEVISRVSWQPENQRRVQTVEVKTYLFNVYQN